MKRNTLFTISFAIVAASVSIFSCNKFEKTVLKQQYLPEEIPTYQSFFSAETNAQVHLGRALFYDKSLSINNSVSCASCHKQEVAFADNVAHSVGFENRTTPRNSIAIQNLTSPSLLFFGGSQLFWDGRETSLLSLISRPIANHIEMGMSDDNTLMEKLNQLDYVKRLSQIAFGTPTLTKDNMALCISNFLQTITSTNSKFDRSFMNNPSQLLNAQEQKGFQLFNTTYQCNKCHNPSPGSYFSQNNANIGLDATTRDKGKMNVTNKTEDEGVFKVPDLHNVSVTAPYMHDGRFATLDDVLNHYSQGIQANKNLHAALLDPNGQPIRMNIPEEDKKAIIAFLNTMTDYTVLSNPLLSNPFKLK